MDIETIFGAVLRKLRNERNMSQEVLAFEAGLDRTYISLLERGERKPTINTIFALAYAMRIKPSELVKEVEEKYNQI